MWRFAGRTVGAISLILLLGTAGLWVRSYWFEDEVKITGYEDRGLTGDLHERWLTASKGYLKWEDHRSKGFNYGPEPGCEWKATRLVAASVPSTGGGGGLFGGGGAWETLDDRSISLPLWGIVLPLAVVSLFWLRGVRQRHRQAARLRRGLCVECGYDVRANKETCPECGVSIVPAAQEVRASQFRELRPIAAAVALLILLSSSVGFAEQRWRIRQHTEWAQYCLNAELRNAVVASDFKRVQSVLNAGAVGYPAMLADAMNVLLRLASHSPTPANSSREDSSLGVDPYELSCLLVEKGADPNLIAHGPGLQILAINMANSDSADSKLKLARLLLSKGADPNRADRDGTTPLHEVSCYLPDQSDAWLVEFARLLLDSGADVNAKDKQGHTPLTLARWNQCEGLAALLVSRGGRE